LTRQFFQPKRHSGKACLKGESRPEAFTALGSATACLLLCREKISTCRPDFSPENVGENRIYLWTKLAPELR